MGTAGNEPQVKTIEELMLELGRMKVDDEASQAIAAGLEAEIINHPDCTGHTLANFILGVEHYGNNNEPDDGWSYSNRNFIELLYQVPGRRDGLTLDDYIDLHEEIGEDDEWWKLVLQEFSSYPLERQIAEHRCIMRRPKPLSESQWKFLCDAFAKLNVGDNRKAKAILNLMSDEGGMYLIEDDSLSALVDAVEFFCNLIPAGHKCSPNN